MILEDFQQAEEISVASIIPNRCYTLASVTSLNLYWLAEMNYIFTSSLATSDYGYGYTHNIKMDRKTIIALSGH